MWSAWQRSSCSLGDGTTEARTWSGGSRHELLIWATVAGRLKQAAGLRELESVGEVPAGYRIWRSPREDPFLFAGRLVPYERPEIAVTAARRAGVRMVVAGAGRSAASLRKLAGPGVQLLDKVSDTVLYDLYRWCRELVFPGAGFSTRSSRAASPACSTAPSPVPTWRCWPRRCAGSTTRASTP